MSTSSELRLCDTQKLRKRIVKNLNSDETFLSVDEQMARRKLRETDAEEIEEIESG